MKLLFTRVFTRNYHQLPAQIQKQVDKQLALLLENPRHPSLNIKKMKDPREIWEGRVSATYRFAFQIKKDIYILRQVGTHDILKRL